MKRGLVDTAAVGIRVVAVVALLAIPLACAALFVTGLVARQSLLLYGERVVGGTSVDFGVIDAGEVYFGYARGWDGIPPARGRVAAFPGVSVNRSVVTLTGETRGQAHLSIRVRTWLLVLVNVPPHLVAVMRVRSWRWRRRAGAGRCVGCGYDLRATPDRCPECGMLAGGGA
jgi:hypothetical protein